MITRKNSLFRRAIRAHAQNAAKQGIDNGGRRERSAFCPPSLAAGAIRHPSVARGVSSALRSVCLRFRKSAQSASVLPTSRRCTGGWRGAAVMAKEPRCAASGLRGTSNPSSLPVASPRPTRATPCVSAALRRGAVPGLTPLSCSLYTNEPLCSMLQLIDSINRSISFNKYCVTSTYSN